MMTREQKIAAAVYGTIYGMYALAAGVELAAKKVKKVHEEKNKKKTIEHADSEKMYKLAAEKSVGWWQQAIQDALDALEARSWNCPSERVVVTNAMARETRAYCLNHTPEVDGEKVSYLTGATVKGLEAKIRSNADYDKQYEVGFMINFKIIEGTLVPYATVFAIRSYVYNLDNSNFTKYNELAEKLDEKYKQATKIVEQGAVEREKKVQPKAI